MSPDFSCPIVPRQILLSAACVCVYLFLIMPFYYQVVSQAILQIWINLNPIMEAY